MTFDEYEVLIPPAHRYPHDEGAERSKFVDLVELLLSHGVDFWNLLDSYQVLFNLEVAEGKQLDALGALVGADRQLPFYVTGYSGILSDDDYRLLIRARIAMNIWDGTTGTLSALLRNVYKGYGIEFQDVPLSTQEIGDLIEDDSAEHRVMHMKYRVRGTFSDLQKQMINGDLILPRPAGVEVTYEFIDTLAETDVPTASVLGSDFMEAGLVNGTVVPSN